MTQTSRTSIYRHIAVALIGLGVAASALPAQAQWRGGYHGRPVHYRGGGYRGGGVGPGGLIAGAVLGVIAGTAIANATQPPPAVVYTTPPPPPPPGVVYYNNGYPPPPPPNGYQN